MFYSLLKFDVIYFNFNHILKETNNAYLEKNRRIKKTNQLNSNILCNALYHENVIIEYEFVFYYAFGVWTKRSAALPMV